MQINLKGGLACDNGGGGESIAVVKKYFFFNRESMLLILYSSCDGVFCVGIFRRGHCVVVLAMMIYFKGNTSHWMRRRSGVTLFAVKV